MFHLLKIKKPLFLNWDNAEVELEKNSFDKMLGFSYHDDVGKVTESVSISAIFDKLLQKHVLLRAFSIIKR